MKRDPAQRHLLAVDASSLHTEVVVLALGEGVQLKARRSAPRTTLADPVPEGLLYQTLRDANLAWKDLAGWALGRPPPDRPQQACDDVAETLGGLALCYDRQFFEVSTMGALAAEMSKVADQQNTQSVASSALNLRALTARIQRTPIVEVAFGCSGPLVVEHYKILQGRAVAATRSRHGGSAPALRVLCGVVDRRRLGRLQKTPTVVVPRPRATDIAQALDLQLSLQYGRRQVRGVRQ